MKKCKKCKTVHGPPTGKRCQRLPVEAASGGPDVPPDLPPAVSPEVPPEGSRSPSPGAAATGEFQAVTHEALTNILEAIRLFDARLEHVEVSKPGDSVPPTPRDLEAQADARLEQLNVCPDWESEDEWEPAGAGAPRVSRGKPLSGRLDVSGEGKTAKDRCRVQVDWPQFYVFRGAGREPATYSDLSIQEFVLGYMALVGRSTAGPRIRDIMYRHLQELMLDATRYPWPSVRHYNAILFHHMEMGEITWEDRAGIQELRANYASQALCSIPQGPSQGQHPGAAASSTPRFCGQFQVGTCRQSSDHDSPRGPVIHACAYCLRKGKGRYPHGEQECRRKKADNEPRQDPKNAE